MLQSAELSKKYENYIAMVEHFKIPEFEPEFEQVPKKSGADTSAINPTAQNENNDNNPETRISTLPRITPDKRENKTPTFRPR